MIIEQLRRFGSRITTSATRRNMRQGQSRPAFIVGSGRSGNTLLRRLLVEKFDLFIPPETYVLGDIVRSFPTLRRMKWRELVVYVAGSFEYHPEFRHFGIRDLKAFVNETVQSALERRTLEDLLDALYFHFSRAMGDQSAQWGDKTPYNIFALDDIAHTFPAGKFVNIVRDGVDVVHSYLAAGIFDSEELAADRWVYACERASKFEKAQPQRMTTVKYEMLVREPEAEVARIGSFLGLATRVTPHRLVGFNDVQAIPHLANATGPVVESSVGKGRASLSPRARSQLRPKMNKTLTRLGYEPL